MDISTIFDIIQIIGFTILFFAPFDKKRARAGWAKTVFMFCSVIGIVRGVIGLAWDLGWISLSSHNIRLYDMDGGLLLGLLISLIVSGQLGGQKQTSNKSPELTPVGAGSSATRSTP